MRSVAHVLRTRHGSGDVLVASQKTGTVNLVVSRKSGGEVRAPGKAGNKRIKKNVVAGLVSRSQLGSSAGT